MASNRAAPALLLTLALWLGAYAPAWGGGISVEGSLAEERAAARGEVYRGVIAIRNTGDEPAIVTVYQADYSFAADGSNSYGTPGRLPRSNASWVRLAQDQYTIAPKSVANVQYEVKVPAQESLRGTYWSLVMVEPLSAREGGVPAAKKGEVAVGLAQVVRYAVQMVTEVGDGAARELEISAPELVRDGARRVLRIDVANRGEQLLKPALVLELNAVDGGPSRKFTADKRRVYPGTSVRYQIDLGTLPPGRYRALAAADAGGDDLYGGEFELALQ
jgi:hypothetical protein